MKTAKIIKNFLSKEAFAVKTRRTEANSRLKTLGIISRELTVIGKDFRSELTW